LNEGQEKTVGVAYKANMTPVEETNSDNDKLKKKSGGGGNVVVRGLVDLLGVDDQEQDPYDDERDDAAGFTKDYLQRTSLHGLQ